MLHWCCFGRMLSHIKGGLHNLILSSQWRKLMKKTDPLGLPISLFCFTSSHRFQFVIIQSNWLSRIILIYLPSALVGDPTILNLSLSCFPCICNNLQINTWMELNKKLFQCAVYIKRHTYSDYISFCPPPPPSTCHLNVIIIIIFQSGSENFESRSMQF